MDLNKLALAFVSFFVGPTLGRIKYGLFGSNFIKFLFEHNSSNKWFFFHCKHTQSHIANLVGGVCVAMTIKQFFVLLLIRLLIHFTPFSPPFTHKCIKKGKSERKKNPLNNISHPSSLSRVLYYLYFSLSFIY